ncbi:MAG TPA: hypothetical protein VG323_16615 [Thermoanaerobaculia bacterium]|nr:hypothetical protein [Thermoanaerobaculia bacterium]
MAPLKIIAAALLALSVPAMAALIPSADGRTIYDTTLHVSWLANANLAATQTFGVANITPGGSMDYPTALLFVAALNAANYLGHNNWQLPATPLVDPTCGAVGPNGASFGKGCTASAMGALFYQSLGLQFPNTAVPIPSTATGPFSDFQPYLYWSGTAATDASSGFRTFSFNTGWEGSNVDNHYMYVLPAIKGKLPAGPADGKTFYDPATDFTWLADADLAKTQMFGSQCTNHDGTLCINPDGSMSHTTAVNWIKGMDAAAWLGQTNWELAPIPDNDPACSHAVSGGFGCIQPFGNLYYNLLKLAQGTPVVPTPNVKVGPFSNVQPYLYWSCQAATGSQALCGSDIPAPNFAWSFSFGNGFQGTDLQKNDLYVMVYFPVPPRHRAVRH